MATKTKTKEPRFGDDHISNELAEEFGESIKKGTEVLQKIRELQVISLSPAVDSVLNGGIREGSIVGIAGPPKVGKTTAVLHFAVKCQQLGKKVIYLNTEGRMNSQNFDGVKGLSVEDLIIVESTDDQILSGEKFLTIAEKYIKNIPGCVVIVDSLSNLVPEKELTDKLNAETRNKLPRLNSMFFKRILNDITRNKAILICVAHQIADTGPSMRTKMTDCGNMFQYSVSTNLEITHRNEWNTKKDNSGDTIGQVLHWKVITSNTGGIPFSKADGWLRYGIGIDEAQELFFEAAELRFIKKGGSWYAFTSLVEDRRNNEGIKALLKDNEVDIDDGEACAKFLKFQGGNRARDFIENNPAVFQFLSEKIREF